ncbi:MAG TPA: helix-turn-helix domain-containing protein [Pseudonocardia sp.]|jgi:AcrR family transcriptional regulator|uniref:TetR/AcrR family transcriptional regulator n=1 Tax=Pseudonocardia sp. TaxID=60912 RepID=UPI002B4B1DEA|nr:helix-turn-helix domain-containing protein [Pseudonocardia sp.]HLU58369.1 helix-turn-helix domain-containing protein [Pseudonocardia sp.]
MAERALRADARRNRERVLAAARRAFAERGYAVPLDEIAAAAGVGPGTVYRHFPTKEALFEAVSVANVEDLAAEARARAGSDDPVAALSGFLDRVADQALAKRDLPDAFAGAGAEAMAAAVADLHSAFGALLERAKEAGGVRRDISVSDLIALLKGLLHAVGDDPDPNLRHRLLAVVRDGLRPSEG